MSSEINKKLIEIAEILMIKGTEVKAGLKTIKLDGILDSEIKLNIELFNLLHDKKPKDINFVLKETT